MALPTAISPESLVSTVRELEERYRGGEHFLELKVMADIFYQVAKSGKLTGNLAPFAVEEWFKAARSEYEAAKEAYMAQTEANPERRIQGFLEGLEERVGKVDEWLGYVVPRASQRRHSHDAREIELNPQLQPQPETARQARIAVMDR